MFKQGPPIGNVTTLLNNVQYVDPSSPDIDEDNQCQSWGHDQFIAGGISLCSSLTTWQDIGNVTTAFKLVVAALKTCQEAQLMCTKAGVPKTSDFVSNIYLEQVPECLEKCWVNAGGVTEVCVQFLLRICYSCLFRQFPLTLVFQLFLPLPLAMLQWHQHHLWCIGWSLHSTRHTNHRQQSHRNPDLWASCWKQYCHPPQTHSQHRAHARTVSGNRHSVWGLSWNVFSHLLQCSWSSCRCCLTQAPSSLGAPGIIQWY